MPAIAIPVARRVGGLRGRNADEEGDGRKGAKDESHRVTPVTIYMETTRWLQMVPLKPIR